MTNEPKMKFLTDGAVMALLYNIERCLSGDVKNIRWMTLWIMWRNVRTLPFLVSFRFLFPLLPASRKVIAPITSYFLLLFLSALALLLREESNKRKYEREAWCMKITVVWVNKKRNKKVKGDIPSTYWSWLDERTACARRGFSLFREFSVFEFLEFSQAKLAWIFCLGLKSYWYSW